MDTANACRIRPALSRARPPAQRYMALDVAPQARGPQDHERPANPLPGATHGDPQNGGWVVLWRRCMLLSEQRAAQEPSLRRSCGPPRPFFRENCVSKTQLAYTAKKVPPEKLIRGARHCDPATPAKAAPRRLAVWTSPKLGATASWLRHTEQIRPAMSGEADSFPITPEEKTKCRRF